MKEHKYILSALISLMLCFSFSMDVYAVTVQEKAKTETKNLVVKQHNDNNDRLSGSCRSGFASQEMSTEEKERIIQNLVDNMVSVSGGTFTMGATSKQHSVTLSSYYIGKYEVTQAEWKAVMGSNPSDFKGDDRPVENVSWDDCQTFISRLNSITGRSFSLPTDAQWEFAARGGNSSRGYKYSGSNNLDDVAWYDDNSGDATHDVGTKSANELGLYDMSGNVWEWCSNVYNSQGGFNRVRRGGSWDDDAGDCRVRNFITPDYRYCDGGLRLVL